MERMNQLISLALKLHPRNQLIKTYTYINLQLWHGQKATSCKHHYNRIYNFHWITIKFHPNCQYLEIFEIINFKGHTLESTNWLSRNTTFSFCSLLTSIISQLSNFITFNVFEIQEEYFVLFASLLFAKHANHLPKNLSTIFKLL